jgi:hypothetical protein
MTILPAALAHAAVPTVAIKGGNVVLTDNGQQRQLTKSGKDADPVLSPDGKWVAYTRVNNPGSTGSQGDCKSEAMADELRRTGTNGSGDELLVRGQDSSDPKSTLCDFSHKQFTSDGRYIFFLSPAWAVSAALHRYDTLTKVRSFVIDANDVIVLNDCKRAENRDSLVVLQHRYFVVAGSYDWYWLFDAAGKKEKGPVGEYGSETAVRDAIKDSTLCDTHKD